MNLLITGATGFLGREIVWNELALDPEAKLTLLIRGKDAAQRGDQVLAAGLTGAALEDARKRVTIVRADLEQERFGLDQGAYDALASQITGVIHGAASVSFTLPIEEARAINVEGTRKILDFAKQANARTDYVGTAYVAGERDGLALESDLDVGQTFRNTYEQTKMESEKLVRSRMAIQPITIFRPSIIVGDSATGRTSSFKVLYWPLKMFSQGFAVVVPGREETRVDIVPSDYVVKAIGHIRRKPESLGKTYHLAAGPERSVTLGELVTLASEFFRVRRPLFVNPERFIKYVRPLIDRFARGKTRHVLMTARVYTPYLSLRLLFDTREARAALEGSGIAVPPVNEYFTTLFKYAVDTDWGKKTGAE